MSNDVKIESATNVTQFELLTDKEEQHNVNVSSRLITLIGEYHEHNFKCKGYPKSITINDYLQSRVKKNNKCKILLEFHPNLSNEQIGRIGTDIIQNIYNRDTRDNDKIREHVVGIDIRTDFIGREGQTNLYNKSNLKSKYTTDEFKETFINPFFEAGGDVGLNSRLQDLDETAQKNLRKYTSKIYKKMLQYESQPNPTLLELQEIWAMITDFEVLLKINEKTLCDEIIVCIGDFHRINLSKEIARWSNTIKISGNDNISDSESCVSVDSLKNVSDLSSDDESDLSSGSSGGESDLESGGESDNY